MLWTSIVMLIGFLWIVGKVSAIKFGGINLLLLALAAMVVLAETVSGRHILKKTNARFTRSSGMGLAQNEVSGLIEQTYQEAL